MSKTPEQMAEEWANAESDLWFADISTYTDGHKSAVKQAYLAGYQAAQQWISVKDRLPEQDVAVLTYGQVLNDPPEVIGVRRRYNSDQEWKHTWEFEDGFINREDYITHWMPLPAAPKEEL